MLKDRKNRLGSKQAGCIPYLTARDGFLMIVFSTHIPSLTGRVFSLYMEPGLLNRMF